VILAAENVVDLQFFLMDAAKRHVAAGGAEATADDLLASAAALDYALLLSSQHADEPIDDTSPIGFSLRDTMTRAAASALDAIERTRPAPGDLDAWKLRVHAVFGVIAALRERGVVTSDELGFRAITLAEDVARGRRPSTGSG
jgi:hypothetical protein